MYYVIVLTLIEVYLLYMLLENTNTINFKIGTLILTAIIFKGLVCTYIYPSEFTFLISWFSVFLISKIISNNPTNKLIEISFIATILATISYKISYGIIRILNESNIINGISNNLFNINNLFLIVLSALIMIGLIIIIRLLRIDKFVLKVKGVNVSYIAIILVINLLFKVICSYESITGGIVFIIHGLINLCILFLYSENLKLRYSTLEKEKEVIEKEMVINELSAYVETIEELSNQIKEIRHDCKNIILGTGIDSDKINDILSMLEDNINDKNKYKMFLDIQSIMNPIMKSMLYYHIVTAMKKGIYIDLHVEDRIKIIQIDEIDLSRIVGILLENAVEEAEKSEKKRIEIYLEGLEETVNITISNSVRSKDIDIKKIYDLGYSGKGKDRGMGLNIVRKIIDKHPNVELYTSLYGDMFIQELFIKDIVKVIRDE